MPTHKEADISILKGLEPAVHYDGNTIPHESMIKASKAISLKRIADALEQIVKYMPPEN
jgi:hypothetical protein